jgi:hypothetical protein
MKKMTDLIEKYMRFVEKYGVAFHGFSILFWCWMVYLNYQTIKGGTCNTGVKFSMTVAIVFTIASTIALILAIKKRKKRN